MQEVIKLARQMWWAGYDIAISYDMISGVYTIAAGGRSFSQPSHAKAKTYLEALQATMTPDPAVGERRVREAREAKAEAEATAGA